MHLEPPPLLPATHWKVKELKEKFESGMKVPEITAYAHYEDIEDIEGNSGTEQDEFEDEDGK